MALKLAILSPVRVGKQTLFWALIWRKEERRVCGVESQWIIPEFCWEFRDAIFLRAHKKL